MPSLTVNGAERDFADDAFPQTVAALLRALRLEPERVVAEVDGEVVAREAFGTHALAPGARVELVRFVGGG